MNKEDKSIALFVAFCIEEYGAAKKMSGSKHLLRYSITPYWENRSSTCSPLIFLANALSRFIPKVANGLLLK